jgi:hypothetical protein
MPVKDIYHEAFVRALEKDGWTITHDPLTVTVEAAGIPKEEIVPAFHRSMSAFIRATPSPDSGEFE